MGVLRKIGVLAKEVPAKLRAVDAWQLKGIYAAMPGLYEWVWNEAPPASGDQEVMGHDHTGTGSGDGGGVEIPMGCILDVGFGAGSSYMWQLTSPAGSVWTVADNDYSPKRSTGIGHHWKPHVTYGLSTSVHAGLFAEGWLALSVNGTCDARIHNGTTGTGSTASAYTGAGTTIDCIRLPEIPISGNVKNAFTLQYRSSSEITVTTYGVIIGEVYKPGASRMTQHATPLSQPPIAGEVP